MPRRKSGPEDQDRLQRRRVLQGLGGVVGGAALGCAETGDSIATAGSSTSSASSGSGGAGGTGGMGGAGGEGGRGGAGGAGGAGPSCSSHADLTPEELLAPIDTIVVLCMENRSFDHYLGSRQLKEGLSIDGLSGTESNPDPNGVPVPVFHLNNLTPPDLPHDWDPVHAQWNMGQNDGFVIAHAGPTQQDTMGYYVRAELPITYALADAFTVCERWFCSVLGPTWPNRFYLHAATSDGEKGNFPQGVTSIFELLADAGVSTRNYFHDIPWRATAYGGLQGNSGIETFLEDAAAGTLPQFSIIDPQFFGGGANDDHPDHDITLGQALIAIVYGALAQSPQWDRCLFVLTYDEHGGFYDHVPPPTTFDDNPEFAQLGFRVPTVLAGPHVRRGCTNATVMEHVSIIKTLTRRYGLPSLNGRVDATNDVSSAIDPAYLAAPQPPPQLPVIDVSMSALAARAVRPRPEHHVEMRDCADGGLLPRHLDRRADGDAITRRVLAWGERLGAVRIRP